MAQAAGMVVAMEREAAEALPVTLDQAEIGQVQLGSRRVMDAATRHQEAGSDCQEMARDASRRDRHKELARAIHALASFSFQPAQLPSPAPPLRNPRIR